MLSEAGIKWRRSVDSSGDTERYEFKLEGMGPR